MLQKKQNQMRPIKIVKNRSDIGAGTRGSDMGVDALEVAAINLESDFFHRHPFIDIPTHNETIYDKVNNTFAKRIHFVAEQCERVCETVAMVLQQKCFPLILSGDHSSAAGSLAGLQSAFPQQRMGVVWIDAHADLHSPFSSPSGNVHGMPLAAALGYDNTKYGINVIDAATLESWNSIKTLGGNPPSLLVEDLIYFGLRSFEDVEEKVIAENGIQSYSVSEIRHRGIQLCLEEAKKQLEDVDFIYITFDVDAMDCHLISQGTGTPEPKGFDPEEIHTLINGFFQTQKVRALEVCEINPLLDEKGNKMAETAFKILQRLFP